jgi:hypothetical protein
VQLLGVDVGALRVYVSVFDLNRNQSAQDDARVPDLDGRLLAAFKRGVRLLDARNLDCDRRGGRKRPYLELVNIFRTLCPADVHLFSNIFSYDVDDELAGGADLTRGVLGDQVRRSAIIDADSDDGRISREKS